MMITSFLRISLFLRTYKTKILAPDWNWCTCAECRVYMEKVLLYWCMESVFYFDWFMLWKNEYSGATTVIIAFKHKALITTHRTKFHQPLDGHVASCRTTEGVGHWLLRITDSALQKGQKMKNKENNHDLSLCLKHFSMLEFSWRVS